MSIDWGGTELKGACFGANGMIRDFRFPSANLRVLDEEGLNRICHKLREITLNLPGQSHLWLIGAAGADDQAATGRLKNALLNADESGEGVEIYSDYACNHAACLGGGDGLLSINGTGSVLYGLSGEKSLRISGWGYLLDETPSGSYFGRRAIEGTLRHLEGEPGYEAFAQAWRRRFDEPDRRRIIDELYRSNSIQQRLGSFAPVLTDAYEAGSMTASRMILDSASRLAACIGHLMRQLNLSSTTASGSGGLWAGWAPFAGLVKDACTQHKLETAWHERKYELFYGPIILHAKHDFASADLIKMINSGVKQ